MGEYLRRVNIAQEWTVEAALTGDRTLVLEAMLADAMATQISYDDLVTMTGEMLDRDRALAPAVQLRAGPHRIRQMAPRIVIIGGGSYQWVPKLLVDIVNTPSLADAELVLEDVNPEPLDPMADFVRHVADAEGRRPHGVERPPTSAPRSRAPTTSSSRSRPADSRACATTSRSPSGTASSSRSATASGPGGIMRALRNIPVLVGIARDMEDVCPDAWMLNITNPMTTLCRSVTRETSVKTRRAVPRGRRARSGCCRTCSTPTSARSTSTSSA